MIKRVLVVLLILAAIAGGGFYYWTTTPQYAVQQAVQAIKQHDVQKFGEWVDVRNVANSAVEDLASEPVRAAGGVGILERIVGLGVISVLRPMVVEKMTNKINEAVAKTPADEQAEQRRDAERSESLLGQIVQLVKPPSLTETLRDYGFSKQNFRGIGSVAVQDNIATVPLKFYSPKKAVEFEVNLELQRPQSQSWRIERISNLQQIVVNVLAPNRE